GISAHTGTAVSTSTSYLRSISNVRDGSPDEDPASVIIQREIFERLVVPVVDLGGAVIGAGVLRLATTVVDHLSLAVGNDQLVVDVLADGDDLPVERASVKSCD